MAAALVVSLNQVEAREFERLSTGAAPWVFRRILRGHSLLRPVYVWDKGIGTRELGSLEASGIPSPLNGGTCLAPHTLGMWLEKDTCAFQLPPHPNPLPRGERETRVYLRSVGAALQRSCEKRPMSNTDGPQPSGCFNVQATPVGKSLLVFENNGVGLQNAGGCLVRCRR